MHVPARLAKRSGSGPLRLSDFSAPQGGRPRTIWPRRQRSASSRQPADSENGPRMPEGDNLVGAARSVGSVDDGVDRGGAITFGASRHISGKLVTPQKHHVRREAAMPVYPVLDIHGIDAHHVLGRRKTYRLAAERRRLPSRMKAEHSPRCGTDLLARNHANCQSTSREA